MKKILSIVFALFTCSSAFASMAVSTKAEMQNRNLGTRVTDVKSGLEVLRLEDSNFLATDTNSPEYFVFGPRVPTAVSGLHHYTATFKVIAEKNHVTDESKEAFFIEVGNFQKYATQPMNPNFSNDRQDRDAWKYIKIEDLEDGEESTFSLDFVVNADDGFNTDISHGIEYRTWYYPHTLSSLTFVDVTVTSTDPSFETQKWTIEPVGTKTRREYAKKKKKNKKNKKKKKKTSGSVASSDDGKSTGDSKSL